MVHGQLGVVAPHLRGAHALGWWDEEAVFSSSTSACRDVLKGGREKCEKTPEHSASSDGMWSFSHQLWRKVQVFLNLPASSLLFHQSLFP